MGPAVASGQTLDYNIADLSKPVYANCRAEWIDDLAVKQYVWDLLLKTPPPLGFDPAPIYHAVDHADFGVRSLRRLFGAR